MDRRRTATRCGYPRFGAGSCKGIRATLGPAGPDRHGQSTRRHAVEIRGQRDSATIANRSGRGATMSATKLVQRLREHDWLAALIELVIVVVGILLALQ